MEGSEFKKAVEEARAWSDISLEEEVKRMLERLGEYQSYRIDKNKNNLKKSIFELTSLREINSLRDDPMIWDNRYCKAFLNELKKRAKEGGYKVEVTPFGLIMLQW